MSIIHSVRNHSPRFMSPEMSCVRSFNGIDLTSPGFGAFNLWPENPFLEATTSNWTDSITMFVGSPWFIRLSPPKKKSAPPRSSCHVRFPRSCTSASVGSGNNSARASRDMWHESTRGNYVDRFPGSIMEPAKSEIWTNLVGQVWLMT